MIVIERKRLAGASGETAPGLSVTAPKGWVIRWAAVSSHYGGGGTYTINAILRSGLRAGEGENCKATVQLAAGASADRHDMIGDSGGRFGPLLCEAIDVEIVFAGADGSVEASLRCELQHQEEEIRA